MCAYAAVNRPAWRNDRLFVVHHDVAGFCRLAHQVEHNGIVRKIEIEVSFHPARVSMGRHCIPHAARFQLGHTHNELSALHTIGVNEAVNGTFIGVF
ncbi:hypothetical protein D3C86_1926900 [compost metagenome]